MRTPENDLWMAVLFRAVQDAVQDDHAVLATAERLTKLRERDHGARRNQTPAMAQQILNDAERTRRRAREWLVAGRDVVMVAEYAGIDGVYVRRLISRLRRNGWQPVGIDLGEGLDKLAVRDREVARGVR